MVVHLYTFSAFLNIFKYFCLFKYVNLRVVPFSSGRKAIVCYKTLSSYSILKQWCHFCLCFFLLGSALADVPTITAYVNETTILPCSITVDGDLPTVEWSKEGISPNITILYRSGCETFEEKNPKFHHRTNLVLNKLKDGDLSQIIHNLQLSDGGTYECRTLRERQWKVEATVKLVVGTAHQNLWLRGSLQKNLLCLLWSGGQALHFGLISQSSVTPSYKKTKQKEQFWHLCS